MDATNCQPASSRMKKTNDSLRTCLENINAVLMPSAGDIQVRNAKKTKWEQATDEAKSQLLIQSCFVSKVHIILRDSAANMKKAIKDLEFERVSCTRHQLNLDVNDAIGKPFLIKKMIRDCKKIVGLMNQSDPARKTFKVIQKEINIEKLPHKLLQVTLLKQGFGLSKFVLARKILNLGAKWPVEQNAKNPAPKKDDRKC
uniref:Uncharacterized protein n=1 Tax=Romanomermis culicivorax TaxID=13658 RepID=A0A915JW90_ROMCU